MKKIKYKTTVLFLIIGFLAINAQKFEKNFSKEIKYSNKEVFLNANYADIEIKEWNKNKIKMEATMTVEGVSKENAQSYFDSWNIDIENGDEVRIISKSKNHFPMFLDLETDVNLENLIFEMPEISLESLDVLDSMDFTFPEINFPQVFNDSIFNEKFNQINFSKLDSLPMYSTIILNSNNSDNLKETQVYLKKWQENNAEYIKELALRSRELAIMHQERYKTHKGNVEKRKLMIEELKKNREKEKEKRLKRIKKLKNKRKKEQKKLTESRAKIREIIKNRDKAKVRTKLILRIPKGTVINMNTNYSKISID